MNLITINGRLTTKPEIKNFSDGTEYCNFSVAVDRDYKAKDGSKLTDFIPCTVTRQSAAFLNKYFDKGDGILITGAMESHKYDKDGESRTSWGVNVSRISFPVGKAKSDSSDWTAQADAASESDWPF